MRLKEEMSKKSPHIKKLKIENFTVFDSVTLNLSEQINVIVGENGTGKSHLLKLMYAISKSQHKFSREPNSLYSFDQILTEKIVSVFLPDQGKIGRLSSRTQGQKKCEVTLEYSNRNLNCSLEFSNNSKYAITNKHPNYSLDTQSVFFPTHELLTISPGFTALYQQHQLSIDETWYDTISFLEVPLTKGPRLTEARELLTKIEDSIRGIVSNNDGKFQLRSAGSHGGNYEISLVAEGFRKLGMVSYLINNGTLLNNGYLFWDEPECNLNPKLITVLANVIVELAASGIQIFIGTHSPFLLRELKIALTTHAAGKNTISPKYFGLRYDESSVGQVIVSEGEDFTEIGSVTAIDESLKQVDRYLNL